MQCHHSDRNSPLTLLNVSYDPTREFYQEYNEAFTHYWFDSTGQRVSINQSHGGSGKQARAVIDGLPADVVTLALAYDIDAIAAAGRLDTNWQSVLPHHSAPYTSTIVFLVRKGNPKTIRDWDDLIRPGIQVITPNPKTSGGARWNYLAAWGYAEKRYGKNPVMIRDYMRKLFMNVPILDTGARGATTTFVERNIGDVLLAWENEALLVTHSLKPGEFEIVVPGVSILAEPPVAVVASVTRRRQTTELARAYLNYLYSETGQRLAAKHYYRPQSERILAECGGQFSLVDLFTIRDRFADWKEAKKVHFADGGEFDRIYQSGEND